MTEPISAYASGGSCKLTFAILVWAVQVGVTVGARMASPRPVGPFTIAAGFALGLGSALLTLGLTIHGCDEGAPSFGWLLSGVLLALTIVGVHRRSWRVGVAVSHMVAGIGVTLLLTDAVHGPTWSGRSDRGAAQWHTPVTGLYRRFPSDRELTSALVERMMATPPEDPCEASAILALAARAEADEPRWRESPPDAGDCPSRAKVSPPRTSEQAYTELLASATEIAAIKRLGDFWTELIFLGAVAEKARWLDPAQACALVAALPADTATWSREAAVEAVMHSITPQARAACGEKIRETLLGPDDVRERLFLPDVYDVTSRRAALKGFAASDVPVHVRVETLAASRSHAGALGVAVDGEILALIDGEPDPARQRALAATALEALQR